MFTLTLSKFNCFKDMFSDQACEWLAYVNLSERLAFMASHQACASKYHRPFAQRRHKNAYMQSMHSVVDITAFSVIQIHQIF